MLLVISGHALLWVADKSRGVEGRGSAMRNSLNLSALGGLKLSKLHPSCVRMTSSSVTESLPVRAKSENEAQSVYSQCCA